MNDSASDRCFAGRMKILRFGPCMRSLQGPVEPVSKRVPVHPIANTSNSSPGKDFFRNPRKSGRHDELSLGGVPAPPVRLERVG